ncbi:polymeric immunoglobulin receptor-like isoform X2 [Dendrobates tinctorius]|uniref:polymeric immunoglobulin receptor-like isoform X2 n=1 Tax=Dendrobates tinctorius TaxID=92724 RepID=UPI003CCA4B3E
MIFLITLVTSMIILCSAASNMTGSVNGTVTLPCTYSASNEVTDVCWGRGRCSTFRCPDAILRSTSSKVIRQSYRYELLGKISEGVASLTITSLTVEDEGTYCCRVYIQGPSNDVRKEINLHMLPTSNMTGSVNGTVTLPCTYSASNEVTDVCWGRGRCSAFRCPDAILRSNSSRVIRQSYRYELLGKIPEGVASLTITSLTVEDEGTYCCKVYILGPSNDVRKEINLQIVPNSNMTGSVNGTVTLPCTYSASNKVAGVCWGRGRCSTFRCPDAILRSNSSRIIRQSYRYELLGKIPEGVASLTITSLTVEDEGTYCCKVFIQGPSNDVRKEMNLQILPNSNMTGSVNGTVTLPCTYSASNKVAGVCWGRGRCSTFRCPDAILRSNSSRIIRQSYRYELLGKIPEGVASLTITSLTVEDEGTYCCKVFIQGPSNDVRKEMNLQILPNGEKLSWGTLGNVIRGIIVLLVPAMVLFIYKRCDL